MFNNIEPKHYHVEYKSVIPSDDDYMISFNGREFLIKTAGDSAVFPTYKDYNKNSPYCYLFSVEDDHYFLYTGDKYPEGNNFSWVKSDFFRSRQMSKDMNFAGITAFHAAKWYRANRYCGMCGRPMEHDMKERMMHCTNCGNMVYPKISPAVILAVYDGDKLLMSKYKNRKNARFVLLAGFAEIGESLEDTAMREAFEETGVRIKNLRYYRSQPWGLTDTLLSGFYAELDGDPSITVQEDELAEAKWIPREDIECSFDDFSLTNDMIWHFKQGDFKELL